MKTNRRNREGVQLEHKERGHLGKRVNNGMTSSTVH